MSAWGDTLTEQLAHDILMDQQHGIPAALSLSSRNVRLTVQ